MLEGTPITRKITRGVGRLERTGPERTEDGALPAQKKLMTARTTQMGTAPRKFAMALTTIVPMRLDGIGAGRLAEAKGLVTSLLPGRE